MADEIAIDTAALDWTPSRWPGILLKTLRREENGPRTVLMKFEPGGRVPRHMHPAGEEILVLEGRVGVEGVWYGPGCYIRSPAGSSNDAYSDTGGLALVTLPKPTCRLGVKAPASDAASNFAVHRTGRSRCSRSGR